MSLDHVATNEYSISGSVLIKMNTKKRILWILLGIAVMSIAVISVAASLLMKNWEDDFQVESAGKSWTYQNFNNGDAIPAEYLVQGTLYLFSTNDAIRKSYDFEKCQVGSNTLSEVDTRFNLPSKDGRALFLVGKFNLSADGKKKSNTEMTVRCEDFPVNNQLAIGFTKENQ